MITHPPTALVWFRHDLRLADNLALQAAVSGGYRVKCIYLMEAAASQPRPLGGASQWWLHHSLAALSQQLARKGARLEVYRAGEGGGLAEIATACSAAAVFWNRRYGAAQIEADTATKAQLQALGIKVQSFNSHLLKEPWEIKNKTGSEFKVFTPYWKACLANRDWLAPAVAPSKILCADPTQNGPQPLALSKLDLLPHSPDWSGGLSDLWQPGEAGALGRLELFLEQGIENYGEDRNRPDLPKTSNLSPHLRFGEISPRQIVHLVDNAVASGRARQIDADKFMSEIGWREFSYHLLYHHNQLATRNFSPRFDAFPWAEPDKTLLKAWQHGRTGYPIVDAGMRQLWQTGTMHNRVRMIAASFLTKHLMMDWRLGEQWFWDTLCDADPANNPASWQWVAGSGADAAPYFRIFNPVLQGEKFDPNGDYVRKFVPELADVPEKFIHQPWVAPTPVLYRAKVVLGRDYPQPIVNHGFARNRALAAFASLAAKSAA